MLVVSFSFADLSLQFHYAFFLGSLWGLLPKSSWQPSMGPSLVSPVSKFSLEPGSPPANCGSYASDQLNVWKGTFMCAVSTFLFWCTPESSAVWYQPSLLQWMGSIELFNNHVSTSYGTREWCLRDFTTTSFWKRSPWCGLESSQDFHPTLLVSPFHSHWPFLFSVFKISPFSTSPGDLASWGWWPGLFCLQLYLQPLAVCPLHSRKSINTEKLLIKIMKINTCKHFMGLYLKYLWIRALSMLPKTREIR